MKRLFVILLLVALLAPCTAMAASAKGSALSAPAGGPAATDKLYVIDNPGGSPESTADTIQNVVNSGLAAPGAIGGTTPGAGTFSTLTDSGKNSVQPGRMASKLSMTNGDTQTAVTEAQVLADYWISNQGDTVETDIKLPALSYPISLCFVVEEALVMEVCPPTGELFDHNGTSLDANDCIDSPAVVGSKMIVTRMQIADGTWQWSTDTVRGSWVDTGATD